MMSKLTENLSIYLVGGAVRDQMLGYPVKDRDWVVTGSTPEQMVRRGFKPVGKDFPVFLHPETGEEYALARTERKTGRGYHGFSFYADPSVTLEQDLLRRDLTINAMAMDRNQRVIDPCGGGSDIQNRILRHVSDAFAEDPVRILRIAKLNARFSAEGFNIAPPTMVLMSDMVNMGEVDALVAERVWQEMHGALQLAGFPRFIETLRQCGALARLVPEVDQLFGVPQTAKYHPEIDTGEHVLMALRAAVDASGGKPDPRVLFAVLLHDLGKALTPEGELPAHRGHEHRGVEPVSVVCDRFRVPNDFRRLALMVCEHHLQMHRLHELKPKTLMKLLIQLDAFRRPDDLRSFIACCRADLLGRGGERPNLYPQGDLLLKLYQAANRVDTAAVANTATAAGKVGQQVGEAIRLARINAVRRQLVES